MNVFGFLIVALLYLVLLVMLIRRGLKQRADQFFCLFLGGLFLWHISLYLYLYVPWQEPNLLWIGRLNYAAGPIFGLGLFGFFHFFPREIRRTRRWERWFFPLFAVFWFVIALFTPLVDKAELITDHGPMVVLGDLYHFYLLSILGAPLGIIAPGIKKFRQLKGLERVKFQYFFWGFIPAFLLFTISNGVLPLFGFIDHFIYSYLLLIPIILSSFYAVVRYRFLDVRVAFSQVLGELLLMITAMTISLGAWMIWEHGFPDANDLWAWILASFILLFIFRWLSGALKTRLSHYLLSGSHWIQETTALETFTRKHRHFDSLAELNDALQGLFQPLSITSAGIFLSDDARCKQLRRALAAKPKTIVASEIHLRNGFGKDDQPWLGELQQLGEVCLPLFQNGMEKTCLGFFILGKKAFDEIYTKQELAALEEFGRYVSLLLLGIIYSAHLSKEVTRKTGEIKAMVAQQSDFLMHCAHELRTPLSCALFQADDLVDTLDSQPEVVEDAKALASSLGKLQETTGKILTAQNLNARKVVLKTMPCDLKELGKGMFFKFKSPMREKEVEWRWDDQLKSKAIGMIDPKRWEQVLGELISNALQLTPHGGSITLSAKHDDEGILWCVTDSGEGVPDDQKQAIFKKFKGNHPTQALGIGLGLYISHVLVSLQGGRIWVEDTPGGGATFCVWFPQELGSEAGRRVSQSPSRNKCLSF